MYSTFQLPSSPLPLKSFCHCNLTPSTTTTTASSLWHSPPLSLFDTHHSIVAQHPPIIAITT
ncbi:putative bromodomain adjacent to zinc finger domain protein [Sesbania bispinosa]|nr:putative bromodomain adjacent to zinc finger domain protein [Sesbania bispinosa]